MLEIEDERWRGAVEGYLNNQKFYFLVEPAYYEQALRIYNKLKWEKSLNAYGLVDIGTLREREHIGPQSGSLAEKVETGNALARTYMDYLLGRVMCCDTVEQLRGYRTAITDEGMLYQGYVARALRRDRMEDAFIGRHAVTLRIARLEEEAAGLQTEISHRKPIWQVVSQQKAPMLTPYYVRNIVPQRQADFLYRAELEEEINAIDEQVSNLDLLWLDQQKQLIAEISDEIAALSRQREVQIAHKARLEERIRQLDEEILPEQYRSRTEMERRLAETFSETYRDDIGRRATGRSWSVCTGRISCTAISAATMHRLSTRWRTPARHSCGRAENMSSGLGRARSAWRQTTMRSSMRNAVCSRKASCRSTAPKSVLHARVRWSSSRTTSCPG